MAKHPLVHPLTVNWTQKREMVMHLGCDSMWTYSLAGWLAKMRAHATPSHFYCIPRNYIISVQPMIYECMHCVYSTRGPLLMYLIEYTQFVGNKITHTHTVREKKRQEQQTEKLLLITANQVSVQKMNDTEKMYQTVWMRLASEMYHWCNSARWTPTRQR